VQTPFLSRPQQIRCLYRNFVLQACTKHGVAPGVFCLGEARAVQLAGQGYQYVAYDTDLGVIMNYSASTMAKLKA
jgi:2-keto-3-deoxy-L-rhamnonate aldolase RhmA